ncbi:M28 family peptidase [Rhodothermus profundi]|uniref:Peptidase family M28 n=1 Tax=Rhodothermus profundi TaxID=633813 RepID=A0A1M6VD65_9BACT|nr:M28 family peptidase [Rhodothermus profundi]SHK79453.1 Peptidase family M28 [Rhodothermus profundi]
MRRPLLVIYWMLWASWPFLLQAQSPRPVSTPTVFDNPVLVQRYQATITPQDLAAHLFMVASDYFEGRETTTRGQKLAAYYLASQYRKLGLKPAGTQQATHPYAPEAYFQPFTVYGQRLQEAHFVALQGTDTLVTLTFGPEQVSSEGYLWFGTHPESTGDLVFGGYGIADAELGYDDYAALAADSIELTGRWLMILADEPMANDSTSLITADGRLSRWTTQPFLKLRQALQAGVAGIILVGDRSLRETVSLAERARRAALRTRHRVGRLSLTPPQRSGFQFPPIWVVSSRIADALLAPSGHTIAALQQQIDTHRQPVVFAVPEVTIQARLLQETFQAQTENVLALIEGADSLLKNEVVILSAHYDHVGTDPTAEGDGIYNGADDDGSGTVALLEIAEAFMQAVRDGYPPRRSILFLHVSGEEKGLLGSAYYTDQEPVFPLEKTVTNLNIDMIGRHDPTRNGDANYVYIIGSHLISQELHEINVRVNEITGVHLALDERFNSKDDPNRFYARSDHWNFGKHGIPFIFFFTGTHEDYHGVDDEPHKIDYDRMARIVRLIFGTAWQVANQDNRPAVTGTGFN